MRKCGVLMHISSLSGKHGIGSLGKQAYRFVRFLKEANQHFWQILPIGQTSYGDSPYQTFSVFAGNPYFIDLDLLIEEKLLNPCDIQEYDWREDTVDYAGLFYYRFNTLRKICFDRIDKVQLDDFYEKNSFWLDDYALFMAVKFYFNNVSWEHWEDDIRFRKEGAINSYKERLKDDVEFFKVLQFLFFKQWNNLKHYANEQGIQIIGDMPIYVAYDSADVWKNPQYFNLDGNLKMKTIAGVPPDCFSEDGQLWGNPIYNWKTLKTDDYDWWVGRIRVASEIFDRVRIDHFRGFASYYEIPFGMNTAKNGEWKQGPGFDLFQTLQKRVPKIDIIAEDLGLITDDVRLLLKQTGYMGMKVLQFGVDLDSEHNVNNYTNSNYIVYTGTHDNDTTRGWFAEIRNGLYKKEIQRLKKEFNCKSYAHTIINLAYQTICADVIIPMQDILNLPSSARMNRPSTMGENWKWRLRKNALTKKIAAFLKNLTIIHNRC